jgi:hypothetical protein
VAIRYETLRAHPEHRNALLHIWSENLSDLRGSDTLAERYRWSYEQNPAGAAETVLAFGGEHDEPIGCGSVYPRRVRVGGTDVRAGIPADLAVARAHRTAGAALGIQRNLVADRDGQPAFFIGFPNKAALPILQRVGYRPFATARGWVKPLSAAYKIRPYVKSDLAARVTATPIDLYLKAADALRGRSEAQLGSEIVDRADSRFDTLWHRARRNQVVAGERTAAYLNWRYTAFADRKHRFFCLTRSGELLGYVAFTTTNGKAFIADLFALDMEGVAEDLLLEFAGAMRRARCQSVFISYAGNPRFASRLERLGFIACATAERKLVALSRNTTPEQEKLVFDADNWHLFDGEMDI